MRRVKRWRFIMLFKQNLISLRRCPYDHWFTNKEIKRYRSDKHFSEFLSTRWWQKSTGTDMEQNYATITQCIRLGVSCSSKCMNVIWTVLLSRSSASLTVVVWPTVSCFADWSKRCHVTLSIIICSPLQGHPVWHYNVTHVTTVMSHVWHYN